MLMRTLDFKLKWVIIGLVCGILMTITLSDEFFRIYLNRINPSFDSYRLINQSKFAKYSTWSNYLADPTFDLKAWHTYCWSNQTSLPTNDPNKYYKKNYTAYAVCRNIVNIIESVYDIKTSYAKVTHPVPFAEKIKKIFNYNSELYAKALEQELYFVFNKYSFEHTVYNPLRGRRPVQQPDVPIEQYVQETIDKTSANCDLCNYHNMTAIDDLGRMENRYAYSAANAFKFDEWHSMFMPKKHDIRKLTFEDLNDVYSLAWQWIRAVHKRSPSHRYPTLLWDSFPHGGASQVHPHIHATVHSGHYYGQFESIRFAAERYYHDHVRDKTNDKKNYFRVLQDIHTALNLTISLHGITILVPITSHKEYDIIVLAENFDERIIQVIYHILQGYFNNLKQYSFSSCLYLPDLSKDTNQNGVMPVYFRIIPRGQASSLLSEVSSLDLLSIYNVNKLPADIFSEISTWFKKQ